VQERSGLSIDENRDIIRPLIRMLNECIKVISNLERDPPITKFAWMDLEGMFDNTTLIEERRDLLRLSKDINQYRKKYWEIEKKIKREFINSMKRRGYLPSYSPEIETLKRALPEELIRGDGRIWRYSYDYYIEKIAQQVGRSKDKAIGSEEIWETLEKKHLVDIQKLFHQTNLLLPRMYGIKAKLSVRAKDKMTPWNKIRVKRIRTKMIERPLKHLIVIKKPIPVEKKKKPKRRILKRQKVKVVRPERQ